MVKDITPFVYDWGQQRHNYQGFGSRKFYSRESGPNDTVPAFTDWTQVNSLYDQMDFNDEFLFLG